MDTLTKASHAVGTARRSRLSRRLSVLYSIQNVGGIIPGQDVGDLIPVNQTLRGLKAAKHEVTLLRLEGGQVLRYSDFPSLGPDRSIHLNLTGSQVFRFIEGVVRRVQSLARLPYFAVFDNLRFFEAACSELPGKDVCHEHNGLFSLGTAMACRRTRVPYILTVSADPLFERDVVGEPLRGVHRAVAVQSARLTYRWADKIICVSDASKDHLVEIWDVDPAKIEVMPNGVDLQLFSPLSDDPRFRADIGVGSSPVVMFVGGLQPWHDLSALVSSFVRVKGRVPEAKLVVVGDGPGRRLLEDQIDAAGIRSSVIITGLVSQSEVPRFLSIADVATIPYPTLPKEIWFSPLKLYEYMAAGKAVVASKGGQISQVIRHARDGLLVEPGDVEGFARAIVLLLGDADLRAELGRNARGKMEAGHSWGHYVDRLEDIYFSAL